MFKHLDIADRTREALLGKHIEYQMQAIIEDYVNSMDIATIPVLVDSVGLVTILESAYLHKHPDNSESDWWKLRDWYLEWGE